MKNFSLDNIKNIIFDLGNVIVNLEPNATYEAFKELAKDDFDTILEKLNAISFFENYEIGKISSHEFIQALKDKINPQLNEQEIIDAWNAILKDTPQTRIDILLDQKEKYRTFCLSNTNEIHINHLFEELKREKGLDNYDGLFEKVYLSYLMGVRKPNVAIFEAVLNENQLIPSETLFIDDTLEHINAAKSLGIKTYHLSEGKSLEQLFRN